MDIRILGALELESNGRDLTPTAPKIRQLTALLVLRRNSVVHKEELIDELWEDQPPRSASATLLTYVHKLRRVFTENGCPDVLQTRPAGYRLAVPDPWVDLCRFESTVARARVALDHGDPGLATELLGGAIALWRGPALAGVPRTGRLLTAYVQWLEESRLRALELHTQLSLDLGRHAELVSELKSLTVMYPFHESFHASLMVALHRCARRNEALQAYRALRTKMITELGLEPRGELQEIQQRILAADPLLEFGFPIESAVTAPRGHVAALTAG